MRDLTGPIQKDAIADLLQGIFSLEIIKPSEPLWILSAWISDIKIIDNSSRQFSGIEQDWPIGPVKLSGVIKTLLSRGGEVIIIFRDDEHNSAFEEKLSEIKLEFPDSLSFRRHSKDFHGKEIVGHDFILSGSMNYTWSGIGKNDENITLRTDKETVANKRTTLQSQWGEYFK